METARDQLVGGPDDSKILMKWNSMIIAHSGARTMDRSAEGRTPDREIEFVTSDPHFTSIYPYAKVEIFRQGLG